MADPTPAADSAANVTSLVTSLRNAAARTHGTRSAATLLDHAARIERIADRADTPDGGA